MHLTAQDTTTPLDRTLTDLIDLGMTAKHACWNLQGPMFHSLRLLLDGLAELARTAADSVAERSMTLGHHPDGRLGTIAASTALDVLPPGPVADTTAVPAFVEILGVITTHLHEAIDAVADDPVTSRLLTELAAQLESKAWVIGAHS